jgi:hypothetical protein
MGHRWKPTDEPAPETHRPSVSEGEALNQDPSGIWDGGVSFWDRMVEEIEGSVFDGPDQREPAAPLEREPAAPIEPPSPPRRPAGRRSRR